MISTRWVDAVKGVVAGFRLSGPARPLPLVQTIQFGEALRASSMSQEEPQQHFRAEQ